MNRILYLVLIAILSSVLLLSVCAKETVVYENDFSNTSLADFTLNGNWVVSNGTLVLENGSGTGNAFITYALDPEYVGKNLRVEVDFLQHTSTGGICIGATADSLDSAGKPFLGYDGFVGAAGTKGAFGCYDADGVWAGNVGVGQETINVADLHLCAEIYGDTILFTITSLDGSNKYFGIEYTIGQSSLDVYDSFSGIIGLRKFYSDKGTFDNFKITLIEEDKVPTLGKRLTVDDILFLSSGSLFYSQNKLIGTGLAMSFSAFEEDFKADITLKPFGKTRFLFGMDNSGNGYAFEVDKTKETVSLYKVNSYSFSCRGTKNVPVSDSENYVSIQVSGGILKAVFDAYFEGEDAFSTFEMTLEDYSIGKFGIWLNGGNVSSIEVGAPTVYEGETYTNSVVRGADPDVLFYDGTYYLYSRVSDGDNIFKVYTSADLAHWTERNTVFEHKEEYTTYSYMSPNAFYYDGIFYLFYAAKNANGDTRLFYATSDSPYGPFTHKNGQIPLHDVLEIGGHPYLDESGKVYMTYVRFGGGNHIWIEEVNLKDGEISFVDGTLTKVISPEFEYEIDGYGAIAEGGVIHKHDGYYYMIYASGHYLGKYGESYAVSKNILGPYTKYDYNEILASTAEICGVGDGIFVPSPDGTELYMVYHKHYSTSKVEERQTCVSKVKFAENPNGGADILTVNGPFATPQAMPSNIYRYDVNRDGGTTLLDALAICKASASKEYNGRFDVDGDGIIAPLDILKVVKEAIN